VPISATRAVLLGGGYGGVSVGIVGGGIAQFLFESDTHVLPLWVAAFIGAIVAGVLSALATRSSLCKSASMGASQDTNDAGD